MTYAVSVTYLNGVKTVTLFDTYDRANRHAVSMLEFKGCRVFLGHEVIAQSPSAEEDHD